MVRLTGGASTELEAASVAATEFKASTVVEYQTAISAGLEDTTTAGLEAIPAAGLGADTTTGVETAPIKGLDIAAAAKVFASIALAGAILDCMKQSDGATTTAEFDASISAGLEDATAAGLGAATTAGLATATTKGLDVAAAVNVYRTIAIARAILDYMKEIYGATTSVVVSAFQF